MKKKRRFIIIITTILVMVLIVAGYMLFPYYKIYKVRNLLNEFSGEFNEYNYSLEYNGAEYPVVNKPAIFFDLVTMINYENYAEIPRDEIPDGADTIKVSYCDGTTLQWFELEDGSVAVHIYSKGDKIDELYKLHWRGGEPQYFKKNYCRWLYQITENEIFNIDYSVYNVVFNDENNESKNNNTAYTSSDDVNDKKSKIMSLMPPITPSENIAVEYPITDLQEKIYYETVYSDIHEYHGWLYNFAGGQEVTIRLGKWTSYSEGIDDGFVEVSGVNGTLKYGRNGSSSDGGEERIEFTSGKQRVGNSIVKYDDEYTFVLEVNMDNGNLFSLWTSVITPEDRETATKHRDERRKEIDSFGK